MARRVIGFGAGAGDRQRDQSRLRLGPTLGVRRGDSAEPTNGIPTAIGGVVAVLGRVVARFEDQVAGLRAFGYLGRAGVGCETKVRETADQERDQSERDHA